MSLLRILMAGNAPPPAGKLFWRFNITQSRTPDVYPTTVLEAEMRSAIGGADLCVGGVASASSQEDVYPASKAFDGLTGNEDMWVPLGQPLPQWLRYNLPSPAEILEVMLQAGTTTTRAARAPQSFDVQWSTDGTTWTTAFTVIGTPAWGTSEIRTFTAQGDPYFDQNIALLHFDGPNGSTTTYDVMGNTFTLGGSAQLRTDQSVFGGSSLYLNGTNQTRALATPTRIPNMHGDLTVEGWFRVTAVGSSIIFVCLDGAVSTHAGHYFGMLADGSLYLRFARDSSPANVSGIESAPGQLLANTWYHLAFVKRGLGVAIYKDGVQVAYGTLSEQPEPWVTNRTISIGAYYNGTSNIWSGWADDVRITNAARYLHDFTPPTAPFPNYRDVAVDPLWNQRVSLLHFDGPNGSTAFTEEAKGLVWTPSGNAQISTAQSRFGGSSLHLAGAGDRVSTLDSTAWQFGSEDFFFEGWIYVPDITGTKVILAQWGTNISDRAFQFYLNAGTLTLALHPGPVFASANGVTANTWHHVAAGRSGPNIYVWLNGVRSGTFGNYTMQSLPNASNAIRIGADNEGANQFIGYIDELRVTRGATPTGDFTPHGPYIEEAEVVDPFASEVICELRFEGPTGTQTYTDEVAGNIWTPNFSGSTPAFMSLKNTLAPSGTWQNPPWGSTWGYFSAGYGIVSNQRAELALPQEFTIEGWIYASAVSGYQMIFNTTGGTPNTGLGLYLLNMNTSSPAVELWTQTARIGLSPAGVYIPANRLCHFAVSRNASGVIRCHINGVQIFQVVHATVLSANPRYNIGAIAGGQGVYGYLKDFRVTKACRYDTPLIALPWPL